MDVVSILRLQKLFGIISIKTAITCPLVDDSSLENFNVFIYYKYLGSAFVPQPYMHHSRHMHALRRPRGCGGRFLNTKSSNTDKDGIGMKKAAKGLLSHPTGSQRSDVLQSDRGTLNSSKEANGRGSTLSGSEVTSIYCRGDLEHFPFNHLGLSVQPLPRRMDNGRGTVMPSKWVATADNRCNPKV